jgi:hypothetical protein
MTANNYERGDFEWRDGEVVWIPSEKGKYKIHPVLGPMPEDDPLTDLIIGDDLAKMIDERMREKLKDINSKL